MFSFLPTLARRAAGAALATGICLAVLSCTPGASAPPADAQVAAATAAAARGGAETAAAPAAAQVASRPASDPVEVVFETTLGTFAVRLFVDESPLSAQNLLAYVDEGFYDGLVFHRVIGDFMVQGGGFDEALKEKATSRPGVRNESGNGMKNQRGTLAMARTNDPDSARAQFFVNVVDNAMLDAHPPRPGYAVVGRVVSGMEVVDAIRRVPTRCSGHGNADDCAGLPMGMQNVPKTPVVIRRAHRREVARGA